MQVVDATEMARLEKLAIEAGASSSGFMRKASENMAAAILKLTDQKKWPKKIIFLAGVGNNGGDAFCTALYLLEKGYEVTGYVLKGEKSPLCQKHLEAYQKKSSLVEVETEEDFPGASEGLLLDGLLGTGFHGTPDPLFLALFKKMNQSKAIRLAIDIPSGLNGNTGEVHECAFQADYTFFLGLPKTGFFMESGWNHVGQLIPVDFGLEEKYTQQAHSSFSYLQPQQVRDFFPKIVRNRHKYSAGFVVGLAGSKGMIGASILSGMGALKSGAGMVKVLHIDEEMPPSSYYPELIHLTYTSKQVKDILTLMNQASCVYIGPGLSRSKKMETLLSQILPELRVPCILDADALNIFSENSWSYPANTLITPHVGEMERLLGKKKTSFKERIQQCQKYVQDSNVTLILKGGPTFIFQKNQMPCVCPAGDPGLATAGSGDVLTGLLAGLWSQTEMDALKVAQLGVTLHGLVGEYVAQKKSSYSLTASDLIKYLYKGFNQEVFKEI